MIFYAPLEVFSSDLVVLRPDKFFSSSVNVINEFSEKSVLLYLAKTSFYIRGQPPQRTKPEAFYDHTNTMMFERMTAVEATPWSHKFRIRVSLLLVSLRHYMQEKTVSVNPG